MGSGIFLMPISSLFLYPYFYRFKLQNFLPEKQAFGYYQIDKKDNQKDNFKVITKLRAIR